MKIDFKLYNTLIQLFRMIGISPAEAIPVLRALADDAQFIIDARAQGMSLDEATTKLVDERKAIRQPVKKQSNPAEVKMLEDMLNLDSIN